MIVSAQSVVQPLSLHAIFQHSALLDLDNDTAFFGVFDGHGAYAAGDLGTAVHRAFLQQFVGIEHSGNSVSLTAISFFDQGPHSDFYWTTKLWKYSLCSNYYEDNKLVVANAAVIPAVYYSRNGQAYNLSRDHKPELERQRERGYTKCRSYRSFISAGELSDDDDFLFWHVRKNSFYLYILVIALSHAYNCFCQK
ncbi:hypothetical protein PR202_gb28064 [Eleusine coracana subsp. coracana]|uniref:protein-serine/threonine phosphatase n=1 Tax=Eleusine coracana subsp. coracana TaxID=191504 RepID=A0AAV5FW54_ELECO|nr:hypothetical protein PR202_gb28064 [Eleusine coracana subsp. coracana]